MADFKPQELERVAEIDAKIEKLQAERKEILDAAMETVGDEGYEYVDEMGNKYKMIKVTKQNRKIKEGVTPEQVKEVCPDAVKVSTEIDKKILEVLPSGHQFLENNPTSYPKFTVTNG